MKYRLSVLAVIFAFAFSTLAVAQSAPDSMRKGEKEGKPGMEKPGMKYESLVQRLNSASTLKTFVELLKLTELDKTLEGTGDFTVFAPTDDAFKKIPADTLASLRKDKAKLAKLLKNHIVAGKRIGRMDFIKMKGQSVKSESGMELKIIVAKGKCTVGGAGLAGLDLNSSNGPIHEVETVIMPGAPASPALEKMPVAPKDEEK